MMQKFLIFFLLLNVFGLYQNAYTATFKLGVLVPEKSSWGKGLVNISDKVAKATGGKVKFKIYYGGVQGKEPDVLRKSRMGQLHGGVFSGNALGEVNKDIRLVEVPFTFPKGRAQAWQAVKKHRRFFDQGFEKRGYVNLGIFEVGPVHLVTTKEVRSYAELRDNLKVWHWSGDEVAKAIIQSMGLKSVTLDIKDVLSSLSTGVIQAAYSSPLGIVAFQWQNKIGHIMEYPFTFAVGALLVRKSVWDKISKQDQNKVKKICEAEIEKVNQVTVAENQKTMNSLKLLGVQFIPLQQSDLKFGLEARKKTIDSLSKNYFSPEAVKILNEYKQ